MVFFLVAFVDCLAILVVNTIFTIFLITYVGTDVSSARSSIQNAYITIMGVQKSSAASQGIHPLYLIYLHLSEVLRKKDAEHKTR